MVDFQWWEFGASTDKLVRKIQEDAAKVVVNEIPKGMRVRIELKPSDYDKAYALRGLPGIGINLFEDYDKTYWVKLKDVFPTDELDEWFTDGQLRGMIKFFENYVAKCKEALKS